MTGLTFGSLIHCELIFVWCWGVWSQDFMKLRFLMSHHRKNSVIDKVIGKKWIYLERNTLHRQNVGHVRRREMSPA